jgi:hypothetical protein
MPQTGCAQIPLEPARNHMALDHKVSSHVLAEFIHLAPRFAGRNHAAIPPSLAKSFLDNVVDTDHPVL